MPWYPMPIQQQWQDDDGDPASGYVLKAYLPGTTTVTSIATDKNGGGLQTFIVLNADGHYEVSGNEVIPYIDRTFKYAIFQNTDDAAANSNPYFGFIDNVRVAGIDDANQFADYSEMKAVSIAGYSNNDMVKVAYRAAEGDGGGGIFRWDDSNNSTNVTNDPGEGIYVPPAADGTGISGAWVRQYSGAVNVRWFGVVGDGATDDSSSIQDAIDFVESKSGGSIFFPQGDYRVTATKGTNDKYGIQIGASDIKLIGESGVQIRRLSSDISTYALSFPILLIGVPDNNSSPISNISIEGLTFAGENTRHAISGSAIMDGRQAIWVKNVKGLIINKCTFEDVDSSAIWFHRPSEFDYENSAYYNNTKCYDAEISSCRFITQSHAVAGRALIHTIQCNIDDIRIIDNYFEWCDVCVSCATTYDDYDDTEDDTYTDPNLSVLVKRVGRGYVIKGNMIRNSSEHAFYLNSMGMSCSGNTIIVDNATVCNTTQFQIRGRGVSVVGNTMTGVGLAAGINTGSMDVTFQGNSIQAVGDSEGGIINVQSQGLTSYIDNRSAYFASYKPARNIVVADNTVDMVSGAQTNGVGIRVYTDSVDANFPDGQMQNVIIKGNVVNRAKRAILTLAALARNVRIESNIFNGKDFTEAGFTTGTAMNSEYVLGIDDSLPSSGINLTFNNNTVWGFEYIMFDHGGAGGAGTFDLPFGIRGNNFAYIKYWDTAAFKQPTFQTMFQQNVGRAFLDRTGWYSNTAVFNALSDDTSNSEKKTMIQLVSSTDVRFYYDDAGGFKAL